MRRVLLGVALSCSMLFAITLTLGWSAAPVAAQGGGAVGGTVKFTGTAPANPKIDMSEEPTCKAKTPNAVDPVVVCAQIVLALQTITSRNVDRVKCRILAEGANGPTTSAADDVLADKGVFVIPDILANAGGVTTSYFEWVQDRQGYFWKESVVNEQLESIMKSSFEDVVRYAETHHVNNRIAAYMLAIDRVAYTIRQRGIYA